MTGRITHLSDTHVTIDGQSFALPGEADLVRFVLELSEHDGCEVEAVVINGVVRQVARVFGAVRSA